MGLLATLSGQALGALALTWKFGRDEISYQTLGLILVDNGLSFMGISIVCSFERLLLPEQRSEITDS